MHYSRQDARTLTTFVWDVANLPDHHHHWEGLCSDTTARWRNSDSECQARAERPSADIVFDIVAPVASTLSGPARPGCVYFRFNVYPLAPRSRWRHYRGSPADRADCPLITISNIKCSPCPFAPTSLTPHWTVPAPPFLLNRFPTAARVCGVVPLRMDKATAIHVTASL